MPRGVYPRSEAQLEGMRERFRAAGAKTKPSAEARQRMSEERTRHGHDPHGKPSKTYQCWRKMRTRCENPNATRYADYGGRGITVCERWHDFAGFLADMGEQPPGLTLDRKDNDGNYEPGNCRWATRAEQNRNQRPRR